MQEKKRKLKGKVAVMIVLSLCLYSYCTYPVWVCFAFKTYSEEVSYAQCRSLLPPHTHLTEQEMKARTG